MFGFERAGRGWLAGALWLAALGGCRLGASTPPADAAPSPAAADASAVAEPVDVEAVLAASDLPKTLDAPLAGDPMAVTVHRLSNGITVYISTDRQQPRFSAWIGVRAGSRMDPPDSTGLAHYLEHMLFKGTDELGTLDAEKEAPHVARVAALYDQLRQTTDALERTAILVEIDEQTQRMAEYAIPNEFDRLYGSMGVEGINAFTSFEQTVYIGDVPSNRLAAWARVEGERFSDPVFRLFMPELESVYEEKNIAVDNANRRAREALYEGLFPSHPYGSQTTLGEVEHLKNPAYGDMVDYFRRWYVPNNMAIALAGDIDAAAALPVLEQALGRLEPRPVPEPPPGRIAPLSGRTAREVEGDGEQRVLLAWHLPPVGHPDLPALTVMDRLLDDDRVGLLNVELELTQKVPAAGSYTNELREGGAFHMWANGRTGQTHEELEALLRGVVARLQAGAFSDEDVAAAKLQRTVERERGLEVPWVRTRAMMQSFITHRQWADVLEDEQRLRGVTRDDVIRVAKAYLGEDFVVVYKRKGEPTIPKLDKPDITPVKIDPSRKSRFAAEIEAMPADELAPRWVKEGVHYERRTLPAGDLISAKNERNELFSLTYRQKRGFRKEPLLCYALDLLELSGAGDDDAEVLQKQLYALGTSVYARCNAESSWITIEGLDSQLEASLAVVDRWLASPRFDAQTLARLYDNRVSERRDDMEKADVLTEALDAYADFGERSPWLHAPSNRALKRARPRALRRLITQFLSHEHRTLYFGPREADAVMPILARGTAHRPTGDTQRRRYRRVDAPLIVFLHKDGAKANVSFTIPRREPLPRAARPAARLLSEYFSGNMSGLVFQEIRESRGLAYSAYSYYSVGERPQDESSLAGYMSTQADKTPEAVRTFLKLLRTADVQPERLAAAKAAIDQEYRASRINPRWINRWVVGWDERGETEDPRPWEWEATQGLTAPDVSRFAESFAGAPVIIAIVGDRERVGLDALRSIGRVEELQIDDLFSYGRFPPSPSATADGGAEPAAAGPS